MARKAKVDNAILKRLAREERARPVNTRNKRKYFLIVCEGEKTEPNYFIALKNDLPPNALSVYNFDIDGTGKNTVSLIDHAINRKNNAVFHFDEVWAVFDRDSFNADQFNDAINKAEANKIKTAWSNEAFELWYVLHFVFNDAAIRRTQYKPILNREISRISGQQFSYKKNDPGMYKMLKEFGDHHLAIRHATKLHKSWKDKKYDTHNPCTTVYMLVKKLCALSNEMHCKV
jgi:hypothetical protein